MIFLTCCFYGSIDCLKYLLSIEKTLKTNIDIMIQDYAGMNGLYTAIQHGDITTFDFLINHVYKNDNKTILSLLQQTTSYKQTALGLALAAKKNVYELVSRLMSLGVDPNFIDTEQKSTETMIMRVEKYVGILKLLFNESKQFKHCFDWVCGLSMHVYCTYILAKNIFLLVMLLLYLG